MVARRKAGALLWRAQIARSIRVTKSLADTRTGLGVDAVPIVEFDMNSLAQ
jgi:hypothetical protein